MKNFLNSSQRLTFKVTTTIVSPNDSPDQLRMTLPLAGLLTYKSTLKHAFPRILSGLYCLSSLLTVAGTATVLNRIPY